MNLLSVGASYGLVVLVFQKGFLIDLFGFEQVDQIEFWLPLFMFSIFAPLPRGAMISISLNRLAPCSTHAPGHRNG